MAIMKTVEGKALGVTQPGSIGDPCRRADCPARKYVRRARAARESPTIRDQATTTRPRAALFPALHRATYSLTN